MPKPEDNASYRAANEHLHESRLHLSEQPTPLCTRMISSENFTANKKQHQDSDIGKMRINKLTVTDMPKDVHRRKNLGIVDHSVVEGMVPSLQGTRMRINSANARRFSVKQEIEEQKVPKESTAQEVHSVKMLPIFTVLAIYFLVLLTLDPGRTVHLVLTILMLFGSSPDIVLWRTILTAIMMPMGVQAKLEVTLCLVVAVWVKCLG